MPHSLSNLIDRYNGIEYPVKFLMYDSVLTWALDVARNKGIEDGYDDGGFAQAGSMEAYLTRLHDVGPKNLSDLIKRHQTSSSPLHAVIYEPFLAWALEVAKDCGLFAAAFFTHACAVDYIFYNVYHEVLKLPVSSTPVLIEGLPLLLELQDLPSFVAVPDSYPANVKMTMSQFANLDKADRVLINTFYKLENEVNCHHF
ncbi:hypothetical protein DKX38_011502 [Salix brachista]|uniref:Uncharacterized protein n=1 Tax=Salix brachista TaxID=2182728 RepID=A0A5N5M1N6_9ROSI|nr:hypothetical protein DKX38_011502 [Salix brachista]